LPVILYGCGTWSLTLREEHRLRGFENRVVRGIFGAQKNKMTEDCTELQNDELHNFLGYNYRVKDDEMGRACSKHGRGDGFLRVLVGKPEGRRPEQRPIRSWEYNIKTDLIEIRWGIGFVWFRIEISDGLLLNMVMKGKQKKVFIWLRLR
jgi:hypothetical protein